MIKLLSIILMMLTSISILSACNGSEPSPQPQENPDNSPDVNIDIAPPSTTNPLPAGDVSSIKVLYNRISWRENMDESLKIQSVEELREYYDNLKAAEYNELDDDLVSRFTSGQYNEAFFVENFLMLITVSETSGSTRHELTSIEEDNGVLNVLINRQLPYIGTSDMAGWLIIIELSNDFSTYEINVVFTDVQLS